MRTYSRNSPEAAIRILALAMLADGHQCSSESAVLEKLCAHEQFGLTRQEMHAVVHAFCQDLLACSEGLCWADICVMHPVLLAQLLDEIDDTDLQRQVMNLCLTLAHADGQFSITESRVLDIALRHWGLQLAPQMA